MGESQDTKNEDAPEFTFPPTDVESKEEKIPYPKSVFFIISNEFCERFSYYGMRTVLTLYFTNVLLWSESTATVIFHAFLVFVYFTPVLGAMLADSLLGKFKTIFYLSIVYAIGSTVLSFAATPALGLPAVPFTMLGLALIAIGTGGIKPCVSAFGGDQFILPQQAAQLVSFFSLFYMAINAGGLVSTFVTPIIRSDVQCFGEDECYALAFAVPAALMVVSIVIFVAGKFLYREVKPSGNVVLKMFKCIGHAISRKRKSSGEREHWLDNADDTFDKRFIEDVKIVLRVLVLYIPLPVFWTLFDQQGSRWTLQATRMDGVLGSFTIQPDQMQVVNSLLILAFIPLFDRIIYPLLAKCNLLKKPLHRLTMGGILAGIAFVISGVVELELQKTYPNKLATTEANINFINGLPCAVELHYNNQQSPLTPGAIQFYENVKAGTYMLYNEGSTETGFQLHLEDCSGAFSMPKNIEFVAEKSEAEKEEQVDTEEAKQGGGFTYMITFNTQHEIQLAYGHKSDDREKPKTGNPKLRFLLGADYFGELESEVGIPQGKLSVYGQSEAGDYEFVLNRTRSGETQDQDNVGYASETIEIEPIPHSFKLVYGGTEDNETIVVDLETTFDFKLGGSYLISIGRNGTYSGEEEPLGDFKDPHSYSLVQHTITQPSTLHMLWLMPQYIVITAGEIMFSITGLEFSYSQAPVSMKSVMQSAWLLTIAFGNLIVVIIAEARLFDEQYKEFFLFAGLMFIDMILFAFMAYRYIPAQLEDPTKKKENED